MKPLCWQLSVYIFISSCCHGFIPRGSFHKLSALPIIFSILAHLGTLKETQIGLEPLQLPSFFNMQTSTKSQWKYWIFHELANKTCLFFLVLGTPTYICANPGVVPETPVWKQIFLKAFSEGSHCQTFKKGDFDTHIHWGSFLLIWGSLKMTHSYKYEYMFLISLYLVE